MNEYVTSRQSYESEAFMFDSIVCALASRAVQSSRGAGIARLNKVWFISHCSASKRISVGKRDLVKRKRVDDVDAAFMLSLTCHPAVTISAM